MQLALAIEKLIPAAKYFGSVTANTKVAYTKLVWKDTRPKPTWIAIQDADATLSAPKSIEEIKSDEMAVFAAASTANDRINLIAQKLGLK